MFADEMWFIQDHGGVGFQAVDEGARVATPARARFLQAGQGGMVGDCAGAPSPASSPGPGTPVLFISPHTLHSYIFSPLYSLCLLAQPSLNS